MAKDIQATDRRKARVRRSIRARAYGKPRLTVFRSSKQIYAQIIDDEKGATIVAASSIEKQQRERAHEEGNRARRRLVDERRLLARAQHGAQRRRKATCNALGDDGAGAAGEHDAADLVR